MKFDLEKIFEETRRTAKAYSQQARGGVSFTVVCTTSHCRPTTAKQEMPEASGVSEEGGVVCGHPGGVATGHHIDDDDDDDGGDIGPPLPPQYKVFLTHTMYCIKIIKILLLVCPMPSITIL